MLLTFLLLLLLVLLLLLTPPEDTNFTTTFAATSTATIDVPMASKEYNILCKLLKTKHVLNVFSSFNFSQSINQ